MSGLARLAELIGRDPDSLVVISDEKPGKPFGGSRLRGELHEVAPALDELASSGELDADTWWSVCPLGELPPYPKRGGADLVVGLPALFADLDADAGKLRSTSACADVVRALSDVLGRRPVAVVRTGSGGLHPYWRVCASWELDDAASRARAADALRRFGQLVEHVAAMTLGRTRAEQDEVDGYQRETTSTPHWVDPGVYELARVLRIPGTPYRKRGRAPSTSELVHELDDVEPLTLDEVEKLLDAYLPADEPKRKPSTSRDVVDEAGEELDPFDPRLVGDAALDRARDDRRRFADALRERGLPVSSRRVGRYMDGVEGRARCPVHAADDAEHSEDAVSFGILADSGAARFVARCHGCGADAAELLAAVGLSFGSQREELDDDVDAGEVDDAAPTSKRKRSMRDRVVELVVDEFDCGMTLDGRPFLVERSRRHVALMRAEAKARLAARMHELGRGVVGRTPLDEAWLVIEGRCRTVARVELPHRVAELEDGSVVLDLGRVDGAVVVVDAHGWRVESDSPVTFRRPTVAGELPTPSLDGDLAQLWRFVPVAPGRRDVVVAWLVAALLRSVPHPIVQLRGPQGAAKSTAARLLARLVDPCPTVPLVSPPTDSERWAHAASSRWVVPVDNVSGIPEWWSDSLCRLVTGAGELRRRLYSDDESVAIALRGVAILNGISLSSALRSDLAERLLPAELTRPDAYVTEAVIEERFAAAWPSMLGGLLDVLVGVLRELPTAEAPTDLRMADYARVCAALDRATGASSVGAYRELVAQSADDALDDDHVARALIALVDVMRGGATRWSRELTVGDLHRALDKVRASHDDLSASGAYWPNDATRLGGVLPRSAPLLRRYGVTAVRHERRSARGRLVSLSYDAQLDSRERRDDE